MKNYMYVAMLGWALMASSGAQAASNPVTGVSEFKNTATGTYWWSGGVGWELTGMLSNELSNTGKFSVVERHKLEPVLTEPDLAVSGRIAKGSGAKVGGMTGAQHPAFETVVAFERKVRDARGRISFTGIYVGGNKDSVSITVDLRVVNTSTGAVDYSRTVEARSDGAGPSLGLFQGGFGGSLKNGDRAPAGKAIHAVIVEISDYLVCAMVRQDGCMADFDARENRRRVSLNDQIELDGL